MNCKKLIFSWVLISIGVIFISVFEQAGVFMAVVPLAIAQNIRIDHDLSYYRYFRTNRIWQTGTAVYYLLLLGVSVVAVMIDLRLMNIPLILFIAMMICPFIFIMAYGDIKGCRQVENE